MSSDREPSKVWLDQENDHLMTFAKVNLEDSEDG